MAEPVLVEAGKRRSFATALDWPGWTRSGRSEEEALSRLEEYGPRYQVLATEAGVRFAPDGLRVVERVPGTATTDFGAPDGTWSGDAAMDGEALDRQVLLLEAAWRLFDRIAEAAPAELRKGPRGGGRDTAKVVDHVLEAELAYGRALGVRMARPAPGPAGTAEHRADLVRAIRAAAAGPVREKGWTARRGLRRIVWHVLDHAWEIEDRSA